MTRPRVLCSHRNRIGPRIGSYAAHPKIGKVRQKQASSQSYSEHVCKRSNNNVAHEKPLTSGSHMTASPKSVMAMWPSISINTLSYALAVCGCLNVVVFDLLVPLLHMSINAAHSQVGTNQRYVHVFMCMYRLDVPVTYKVVVHSLQRAHQLRQIEADVCSLHQSCASKCMVSTACSTTHGAVCMKWVTGVCTYMYNMSRKHGAVCMKWVAGVCTYRGRSLTPYSKAKIPTNMKGHHLQAGVMLVCQGSGGQDP